MFCGFVVKVQWINALRVAAAWLWVIVVLRDVQILENRITDIYSFSEYVEAGLFV